MNLKEIKQAIEDGKKVCWGNIYYEVIKDNIPQYLIHCTFNDHYIGLTHMDEVTMNGEEHEFFIAGEMTFATIRDAVDAGKNVGWRTRHHKVVKAGFEYVIQQAEESFVPMAIAKVSNMLSEKESDFFIMESKA